MDYIKGKRSKTYTLFSQPLYTLKCLSETMSNWWKYALAGVSGAFLGGTAGTTLGYYYGYYKSEPEIMILNYKQHGVEGMCVTRNSREKVCAVDGDNNGSVDVVVIDVETEEMKEILLVGEDTCLNKLLRNIEEETQNQEQPKP